MNHDQPLYLFLHVPPWKHFQIIYAQERSYIDDTAAFFWLQSERYSLHLS